MQPNTIKLTKNEFIVQWDGPGVFVAKMSHATSWHELFSLITPVQPKLHQFSQSNKTVPDASKHNETDQNMNLGSNGLDHVCSLQKCPTRPRGTYFFH